MKARRELLADHIGDFPGLTAVVAERTCAANRLRWHLHELDAGSEPVARSLDRAVVLAALDARLADVPSTVARLAGELVERIRALTASIDAIEREIARLVVPLAPSLLALPGCGPLTAAKLVGETAGIGRSRSAAAFARLNGTAPIPVSSGNAERHRLSRSGNRQLSVALHRIAITQVRLGRLCPANVEHGRAAGDTKTGAIRAKRRRISDEVFRRMRHDDALQATARAPLATAA